MNPKSPRQFRVWQLLAVVAGSAVIFAIARIPVLRFFLLVFGPPLAAMFLWVRHVERSVREKQLQVDAFAQFCMMFVCVFMPIGIYWFVLLVVAMMMMTD